ncbi:MAG TPA: response regulator [Elusimicrobiota bacterium]|nr:response regulator [Elusimicrobiota bacterium]
MANILVVDDDKHFAELVAAGLEAQGHSVVVGFDGQMAIRLAKSVRPDLIVIDVNMPLTTGTGALEFIRKIPATRQIPVIFLTGAPTPSFYPTVEAHSRVAYLKKPFDLESLNSMVRQFLEQYGPAEP